MGSTVRKQSRLENPSLESELSVQGSSDKCGSKKSVENLLEAKHISNVELLLTENHRRLIQTYWSDDFHCLFDIGRVMYQEILNQLPDAQFMFSDPTELSNNANKIRRQALNFAQTLSVLVGTLNKSNTEILDNILIQVGARHKKFLLRGLTVQHFKVIETVMKVTVAQCLAPQIINEIEMDEFCKGWDIFSKYIMIKLSEGLLSQIDPTEGWNHLLETHAMSLE